MALIQCPECRNSVSTKAAACPHCGAPMAVGTAASTAVGRSPSVPKTRKALGVSLSKTKHLGRCLLFTILWVVWLAFAYFAHFFVYGSSGRVDYDFASGLGGSVVYFAFGGIIYLLTGGRRRRSITHTFAAFFSGTVICACLQHFGRTGDSTFQASPQTTPQAEKTFIPPRLSTPASVEVKRIAAESATYDAAVEKRGANTRRVTGKRAKYTIALPENWKDTPPGESQDFSATNGYALIGISAYPDVKMKDSDEHDAFVRKRMALLFPDLKPTESDAVWIDGRRWSYFHAITQEGGSPRYCSHFLYGGPDGTYKILTYLPPENLDIYEDEIKAIVRSFLFP